MAGHIGVYAQYSDDEWPPQGEVVMRLGHDKHIRLDPENAAIIGRALLLYADIATEMTRDIADFPGLAVGTINTRSGYLQ